MLVGLTVALAGVDGFVVTQAVQSGRAVTEFRDRQAALQRAVSHLRGDFFVYDGANNMYVLVAATGGAAGRKLWTTTYQQAVDTAMQLDADLTTAEGLAAGTAMAPAFDRLGTDIVAPHSFLRNVP